jgi:hypothetical protein
MTASRKEVIEAILAFGIMTPFLVVACQVLYRLRGARHGGEMSTLKKFGLAVWASLASFLASFFFFGAAVRQELLSPTAPVIAYVGEGLIIGVIGGPILYVVITVFARRSAGSREPIREVPDNSLDRLMKPIVVWFTRLLETTQRESGHAPDNGPDSSS